MFRRRDSTRLKREYAARAFDEAAQAARVAEARRDELAGCEQQLALARSFEGLRGRRARACPIPLRFEERMFFAVVSGAALLEPDGGVDDPASVMRNVDTGSFTLTTQRAVFLGATTSREWEWSQLLGITHARHAPITALSVANREETSCIAYGGDAPVRFFIDLAVAHATGTRDRLVATLEDDVRECRRLAGVPAPPPPPSVPSVGDAEEVAHLIDVVGTLCERVAALRSELMERLDDDRAERRVLAEVLAQLAGVVGELGAAPGASRTNGEQLIGGSMPAGPTPQQVIDIRDDALPSEWRMATTDRGPSRSPRSLDRP
jgi:hypothetical protein